MLSGDIYTLAGLVECLPSVKRRTVQLWADHGVILSSPDTDHAGKGVHRSFEKSELYIAAMVVPLARLGVPIGILRNFARSIRSTLLTHWDTSLWVRGVEDEVEDEVDRGVLGAVNRIDSHREMMIESIKGVRSNVMIFFSSGETIHPDQIRIIRSEDLKEEKLKELRTEGTASPFDIICIIDLTAIFSQLPN